MSNIFTGQDIVARNIYEVTKLTGISGIQVKRLIETGNASIRGWVLYDTISRNEIIRTTQFGYEVYKKLGIS